MANLDSRLLEEFDEEEELTEFANDDETSNDESDYSLLTSTIEIDDQAEFRRLAAAGHNVHATGYGGIGLLSCAILDGGPTAEWVRLLINEFHLDVNQADDNGWTPLMYAVLEDQDTDGSETIEFLLESGANPALKATADDGGYPAGSTAADIARQYEYSDLATRLTIKPAPPAPEPPPMSLA